MTDWRGNWPRSVLDPFCAQDHVVETPTDRRLLWHIEGWLSVRATTTEQHRLVADLGRYLDETCDHHWHEYTPEPGNENDVPAHRQCLWCNHVEWIDSTAPRGPADGGTER